MARTAFNQRRYSRGAIAFHWIIAVLVIANLIYGLFHESLFKGAGLMPVHMAIGITVLVLSIARLAWRLTHRVPPLPASLPGWEKGLSHLVHWIFYALIILMPLSGWAMTSGGRHPHPVSWFGLFDVPMLPVSGGMAGAGHEFHEIFGYAMAALVVLHIAAALRHQFILRDGVLGRMMPGVEPSGRKR
ncbi:cytochrome b [Stakelama sp. CBK3Z-3]|uniref:Cytochrome b n=1 Tax=Stakelama flava TaxID=2860338 RepID=A0ABS6XHT8_9SPHN|nr:cytochrome b [Stakelama flava]MBW4329782.1 cytochrome b [Stakelama flava]